MAIRTGDLNKRIILQTATPTQDAFGEPALVWATLAERWAAVEPLTGNERFAAQQVNPRVSHKVTIRYLAAMTSKARVLYGTRVLEVDAVLNPLERNESLELLCTENPDATA